MEDSEKLTALKKAYADIILNTAKEAAARIMVSDKKAMQFQKELVSTKDEALRMLVRLKQMLDAKTCESETTSLKHQKKIEELEAQLGEAEDIVRDLREELRMVQNELEKVSRSQMHSQDEELVKSETVALKEILQKQLTSYVPYSVSEHQFMATNQCTKCPTANGALVCSKCYIVHNNINNCFAGNHGFPSIVFRRKEPELYRNGCTQRIRAFGRNLLESNLSLSQQADDIKNEKFVGEDENKQISVTPRPEADVLHQIEKNPDELELVKAYRICIKQSAKKAYCRKWKRETRYKRHKPLSSKLQHDKANEMQNAPHLLCSRNSQGVADDDDKSVLSPSISHQDEAADNLISSPKAPRGTSEMPKQSGSTEYAGGDFETYNSWNESNNGKDLTNESGMVRQGSLSADNLDVSACRAANKPSVDRNQRESDLEDKIPSQSENNMLLKYTFRRKRKKEPLNSSEGDCSPEMNNLMKQAEGKQNGHVESQKSCSNAEPARSNRRLAQVARQLISLSEKKW